jgi:rhodanese-related sulfurtransferase
MKRLLRFAVIVAGALALTAPLFAAENWPDSFTQYLMQVRKTVQTTDTAGYLAAVKNPNGALIIDVREAGEYNAGHVPGAVNIPRGLLEFQIWKQAGYPNKLDMNRRIYVQCKTGGRATFAAKALKDLGFTNVVAAIVNIEEWAKKGYPLVKEESKQKSS